MNLAEDLLTKLEKSLPRSQPSSLQRVFDLAKELQPQFRHSQMEPLHFLAVILNADSSEGAKLLRLSGVTLENVLSELSRAAED